MQSMVIYATHFGNTRRVAEAIAAALEARGGVQVSSAEDAPRQFSSDVDLIVVGGPTESHGITPSMTQFLEGLEPGSLNGKMAAAFDTRIHWPRWMSGSAGSEIARRLQAAGAREITPPESFFVKGKATLGEEPTLVPGEVERATGWAMWLAEIAQSDRVTTSPRAG